MTQLGVARKSICGTLSRRDINGHTVWHKKLANTQSAGLGYSEASFSLCRFEKPQSLSRQGVNIDTAWHHRT